MADIQVKIISDFNHPLVRSAEWEKIMGKSNIQTVFITRPWLLAWWNTFGRGQLLLVVASKQDKVIALAPLFADSGMIFFVGSGSSDYLDFLGDLNEPGVLVAILSAARDALPEFLGFRFYHVPDDSRTGASLKQAAQQMELCCFDEGSLAAPAMKIAGHLEHAQAAVRKKSLVRHERYFVREGDLIVRHLRRSEKILPYLEIFFDQHVTRWHDTPYPSLFNDPMQREFYTRLAETASDTGWLRFTVLEWQGRLIACHFGFYYENTYLWYKPSFAIDLAKRSPGEVLIRQLLLAAIEEDASIFDFGIGEEAFKARFSNFTRTVRTWGIYPSHVLSEPGAKESLR